MKLKLSDPKDPYYDDDTNINCNIDRVLMTDKNYAMWYILIG